MVVDKKKTQEGSVRNKYLHMAAKYFDKIQDIYYVLVVALSAVAFFEPVIASVGLVILLIGSIWNFVDSVGGTLVSMDWFINKKSKPLFFRSNMLICINIVTLLFLLAVTIMGLLTPLAPVWMAFAVVGFGLLVWARIFDNLRPEYWSETKKLPNVRLLMFSLACGGLGSIFTAFFLCISGPVGTALGLLGVIFYLVSGMARVINLLFRTKRPISNKYGKTPLASRSMAPSPGPALVAQQHSSGMSFRSVLRVHTGLQSIWSDIMASIYAQKEALSGRYGRNISCVNGTFAYNGNDQGDIAYMMVSAACAFEMDPIIIHGGTADSQAVAIQEALSLGFIAITVEPPDGYSVGVNVEYERLVDCAHAIRDMDIDPKRILDACADDDQPSLPKAIAGIVCDKCGQDGQIYRGLGSLYSDAVDAVSASRVSILQI